MEFNVNAHASIQIDDLFFDPYKISDSNKKAKIIFLTHTHYDHLSTEDISKITDKNTIFVATFDAKETLEQEFPENKKYFVLPNQILDIMDVHIETLPAYNLTKSFHKKEYNWVGYKITKDNTSFAILGDTDNLPEHEKLDVDVLFVPIGGTYTMNAKEASDLANKISPKIAVPVHYNLIVGNKKDEEIFLKNLSSDIKYKIFV